MIRQNINLASISSDIEGKKQSKINTMLDNYFVKLERNRIRNKYYNAKNEFKDLNISTPVKLRHKLHFSLGWAQSAVDKLAERIIFDDFVLAEGGESIKDDIQEIAYDNNFENTISQATTSTLINSVAFFTITNGDTGGGEPEVLVLPKSALEATALWNYRTRTIECGLSITDTDELGEISQISAFFPDETLVISVNKDKTSVRQIKNSTNRALIEPLIYNQSLSRPFGTSRISRPVMSLMDSAVRTIIRGEISAEVYNAPMRFLLGTSNNAKDLMNKIRSEIGTIHGISRGPDGQVPQLQQFDPVSFGPHNDQLKMWANLLSAEISVPVAELGFPSDNPSSAEAVALQREPIKLDANRTIKSFSASLKRIITTAVMLKNADTSVPQELKNCRPKFMPPFQPSISSSGDAVSKLTTAIPWIANTSLPLEMIGLDSAQINTLMSKKRQMDASTALDGILGRQMELGAETR
ncbi:MAG: phage portal protein [Candidatus Ancillula sp.]|jgi:hypothetical protein|nr:phage portal protein [Candidatus Ancillula sp.]